MSPFAWLLGLVLPACGFPAAQGLPTPPLMDIAHIVRPASPNTALAAPANFSPPPDIVTPGFPVSADRLFGLVQAVAARQPGTFQAALYPDQLQVHYVVRSAVFNFPDLVMAQVRREGQDSSDLVLYSRSVYGYGDFGVNRKRVRTWIGQLETELHLVSEK